MTKRKGPLDPSRKQQPLYGTRPMFKTITKRFDEQRELSAKEIAHLRGNAAGYHHGGSE